MNEEPKRVQLSYEDQARMQRLSEEIRGRLEEMALITSRTLGMKLTPNAVRKFSPAPSGPAEASVSSMEIVCSPAGPCGCYVFLDDGTGFAEVCGEFGTHGSP